jgi:hypothetical protein
MPLVNSVSISRIEELFYESSANIRTFTSASQVKEMGAETVKDDSVGILVCAGEESQDVCTLVQELGMCIMIEYLLTSGNMHINTATDGIFTDLHSRSTGKMP